MNKESIVDSSFDINITTSYFLSIQLQLDGFSFCVLDPISNEYILFEHHPLHLNENIKEVLESELLNNDLLVYPYQKVFVIYQTSSYTLIPQVLFNNQFNSAYLDFCFSDNEENTPHKIYSNKIKMADSICIFGIPNEISELLNKFYKHVRYFCHATPFVETALLSSSISSVQKHVHINIQTLSFDIIVTASNNLQMHNSFKYHNQKDFLYFTLFVFEQMKMDTRETKVLLTGKIDKSHEIYLLLKKYIKQIEIIKETKHFKFANTFKNTQLQDHLNLFNIPLCV